jgi:hypothetical protein
MHRGTGLGDRYFWQVMMYFSPRAPHRRHTIAHWSTSRPEILHDEEENISTSS